VNNTVAFLFIGREMDAKTETKIQIEEQVTLEDVNRILEIGCLLFSVLTPEEIEDLQHLLSLNNQLGNAGDS